MPSGSTDLVQMLAGLDATVRPVPYVVTAVAPGHPAVSAADAVLTEAEGVTVVLPREAADLLGLEYDLLAAWLTLTVQSSLEAVGLIAAFSRALADAGVSCNVLAGYHHDHLLVPWSERERALAALRALRTAG